MTSPTMSLLDRAGLDRQDARRHLVRGLEGADDGELYLEYAQSEMLVFDNGRLKQATYNTDQGFGLRAVKDEAVGYAHSSDVSEAALARAADAVRAVKAAIRAATPSRPAEPMSASTAMTIRSERRPSKPRCGCWRPSTPIPGRRTRASGRFRSRSARPGR